MYCRNCGKEIGNSDKFCKECGTRAVHTDGHNTVSHTPIINSVIQEKIGWICLKCKMNNDAGQTYCERCHSNRDEAGWICIKCKMSNEAGRTYCERCQAKYDKKSNPKNTATMAGKISNINKKYLAAVALGIALLIFAINILGGGSGLPNGIYETQYGGYTHSFVVDGNTMKFYNGQGGFDGNGTFVIKKDTITITYDNDDVWAILKEGSHSFKKVNSKTFVIDDLTYNKR